MKVCVIIFLAAMAGGSYLAGENSDSSADSVEDGWQEENRGSYENLGLASATEKDIQVINNCGFRLYVKNEGGNMGSFNLEPRASQTFQVQADDPRPRVWAHKGCDDQGINCETNEGYVSLAEMHWEGKTALSGLTFYDISHVDGYNLPITMQPFNTGVGTAEKCINIGCNFNIDADCPPGNKKYNSNGRAVACMNDNRDSSDTEYAKKIRSVCPNTYSWSGDNEAVKSCQPGNDGLRVIFC